MATKVDKRIPKNQIYSRNTIEQREHEDDAAARRVIPVDECGDPINEENPLPVSGTFVIEVGVATNPNVFNFLATSINVEYQLVIPDDTKRYIFKTREKAKVQIAFEPGESNTNYFTLKPGVSHSEENIKTTSKVIYFRVAKPNTTIEFMSWS
jgi:hypothetical protein